MLFLRELARFFNKKAQGLPIYAVVVIILGIVILALVLIYILMITGKGGDISKTFFQMGGNISENASSTSCKYTGKC